MAKAVINLQKESGGIVKISPVDGIGVTEVTVPESGELATEEYVNSEVGVPNSPLVKTALNASGEAPIYACRAWVNFNGTGTVAIRASGNVSSITDLGVGNYRVNFATAMTDANYCCPISATRVDDANAEGYDMPYNYTTTSVSVSTESGGGSPAPTDFAIISVSIFR